MTLLIILGVVAFIAFVLIHNHMNIKLICSCFERSNVIVVGKKGRGKDTLFQMVIDHRKKPHMSNIRYNKYTEVRPLTALNIDPNDYTRCICGNYAVIPKTLPEQTDYYISDAGIHLPSQYHGSLEKYFPTLPSFYALSRHLTNSNVHANVQNLTRLWDKLREQADDYFLCVSCRYIGRLVIQKVRYYSEYNAIKNGLRPYHASFLSSKERRALKEDFDAKNGIVKDLTIFYIQKKDHYDTREFHKYIYGCPAPSNKKKSKKKKCEDE